MFCQKCGQKNIDDAKFCSSCGNALGSGVEKSAEQKAEEIKQKSKESASTLFYLIKPLLKAKVLIPVVVIALLVVFYPNMKSAYDDYQYEKEKLAKEIRETFTDLATGLMWQDKSYEQRKKWKNAVAYCNQTYAGYNDWKLPTYQELLTIKDNSKNPAIVSGIKNISYKNTYPSDAYWSSSNYDSNFENIKKVVVFYQNGEDFGGEIHSDKNYCRCVRNEKNIHNR